MTDGEYEIKVRIPEKMQIKSVLRELKKIPEEYDLPKTSNLLDDLLNDDRIKAMHKAANIMVVDYIKYNDHGRYHAIISTRNALKVYLYTYEDVKPNMVSSVSATLDEALFVVSIATFLHDVGNIIHRDYHYFSSFYLSEKIIWEYINRYFGNYDLERRWILFSHIANAIVSHDDAIFAYTLEASSVKVGEGCDMAAGRSRRPYSIGKVDIHSVSALSITEVDILKGNDKPLLIRVNMSNPAGIFQIEEILLSKLNMSILKDYTKLEVMVDNKPIKLSILREMK